MTLIKDNALSFHSHIGKQALLSYVMRKIHKRNEFNSLKTMKLDCNFSSLYRVKELSVGISKITSLTQLTLDLGCNQITSINELSLGISKLTFLTQLTLIL